MSVVQGDGVVQVDAVDLIDVDVACDVDCVGGVTKVELRLLSLRLGLTVMGERMPE